jgi:hypothetical protein
MLYRRVALPVLYLALPGCSTSTSVLTRISLFENVTFGSRPPETISSDIKQIPPKILGGTEFRPIA